MKINKRSSTVESLLMMKRKFVEIEQDMEKAKELGGGRSVECQD